MYETSTYTNANIDLMRTQAKHFKKYCWYNRWS